LPLSYLGVGRDPASKPHDFERAVFEMNNKSAARLMIQQLWYELDMSLRWRIDWLADAFAGGL
jgi:hypothetical protein